MANCSFVAAVPAICVRFSMSSPACTPNLRTKSLAADSRSLYCPTSNSSSSGRPKYALEEMDVAPSKPWRRVRASFLAEGS